MPSQLSQQEEFRYSLLSEFISRHDPPDAIAGRGGPLKPLPGGVYAINKKMISDYRLEKYASHPSNLGALLAHRIAGDKIPAFIVDPVSTDELLPQAKISGVPGIERKGRCHALNIKYCARKASMKLNLPPENTKFIVAHLGSGFSIAAVSGGKIIDVNDALLGMGPFSPDRAGALPISGLLDLAFDSGKSKPEIINMLSYESGLKGYLKTNDFKKIVRRLESDSELFRIYTAMIHQIIKEIGGMFAIFNGEIHGLILTGGLLKSKVFCKHLKSNLKFISRFFVYPGSFELEALADGVKRALKGTCSILEYR